MVRTIYKKVVANSSNDWSKYSEAELNKILKTLEEENLRAWDKMNEIEDFLEYEDVVDYEVEESEEDISDLETEMEENEKSITEIKKELEKRKKAKRK